MSAFAASYNRLVRRAGRGQLVTLRRRNTLINTREGGKSVTTLAMAGAASAGASTIALDAANLAGTIRKGSTLQIAAVAGTYTVQADVTAAAGALAGVTVSPVLAGAAANDAAVTIVQNYGEYTFAASRAREAASTGEQSAVQLGKARFHLSAIGASTAPLPGDWLVDAAGGSERIGKVRPRRPGSDQHGWVVELGEEEAAA